VYGVTLEEVHWIDSAWNFAHVWMDLDEMEHMAKEWNGQAVAVGYVVYETEDRLLLVQLLDGERPMGSNAFLIYKENIIERRELA
jgi:hypothetical protein